MRNLLNRKLRIAAIFTFALFTLQVPVAGAVAIDPVVFTPVSFCHKNESGEYMEVTANSAEIAAEHNAHAEDVTPVPQAGCTSLNEEAGPQADLGITKIVDEPEPNIGGTVTYGLKVTNYGPDDAVNVVAIDTLPAGITFVTADFPGDYDSTTGIWTVGDLANGESATLDIYVKANLDAGDTTVVNTASVSSDVEDPIKDNNSANVSINIGIPSVCVPGSNWASKVIFSVPGTLNDGSPIVDPTRTDDNKTLNAPDGQFFSLGKHGKVKLGFTGFVVDVPGTDVDVYEITNGRDTYPEERALVEISQDGDNWFVVGTASGLDAAGKSSFDIAPTGLSWFEFVRITDTTDFTIHDATADGFDLDAVGATRIECSVGTLKKAGEYNSATGEITYTITWGIYGTTPLDLTITDKLPAGTTYVAGSADHAGVFDGIDTLTWNLGSQPGGATGTVSFKATVDAAAAADMWAKTVVSFSQGKQADLVGSVEVVRSNPNSALGAPQSAGSLYDNPLPPLLGEFVSLGFTQANTGGQIVVAFDHPVYFGPGNDIQIYEITGGEIYPDEQAKISVSNDNSIWTDVGVVVRDGGVDLGATGQANYVRITDSSSKAAFESTADGFDVDAVKALQTIPEICSITNEAKLSWPLAATETTSFTTASAKTVINEAECAENTYKISGKKWNDKNGNGTPDEGEERLPGWTIYIDANDNGAKDSGETSITTDETGLYSFVGLEPGMYILREVNQTNWTQTFPGGTNLFKHVVFVTTFDVENIWFGNEFTGEGSGGSNEGGTGGGGTTPKGSITGVVFNDANNDGAKDSGEVDLSGWVVYLDANDNNVLDSGETSITTASPYLFTGLDDGTYNVREVIKDGWTQTLPSVTNDYKHVVTITGASNITGKHFGNFQTGGSGGSGGNSGGGGGGALPLGGPAGAVAGDSTNTPSLPTPAPEDTGAGLGGDSATPMVLGAAELPRTGSSNIYLWVIVALGAASALGIRTTKRLYS